MAIDPYLTRKAARPAPVQIGWTGRGATIIPYESFDGATLREALAIINGTSRYYRFDSTGRLQLTKHEGESVDHYYERQRFRAQFVARLRTTGQWQSFVDEESALRQARIEKSHEPVAAAEEAVGAQMEKVAPQFHGVHPTGQEFFDFPAFVQWEHGQKQDPTSPLARKEVIERQALEESAPEQAELREIHTDTQVQQSDVQLFKDFRNFSQLVKQLERVAKKTAGRQGMYREQDKKKDLECRLHRAVLLFEDAEYPAVLERIQDASIVGSNITEENREAARKQMDEFREHLNWDANRDTDTLDVLRATLCILANVAGREGISPLSKAIALRVRAHDSPMGRNLEALTARFDRAEDIFGDDDGFFGEIDNHAAMDIRGFNSMDDETRRSWLRSMEGDIVQLRRLDAGVQRPDCEPLTDEEERYYDHKAEIHESERWDKKQLLRILMEGAKEHLRCRTDLMRFHNQFPEAVSFIMASHEGEFLMHRDGRERQVHDLQHFLNSYWMNLAGNAEVQVDPKLLEATRTTLQTQSLRPLQTSSAVAR